MLLLIPQPRFAAPAIPGLDRFRHVDVDEPFGDRSGVGTTASGSTVDSMPFCRIGSPSKQPVTGSGIKSPPSENQVLDSSHGEAGKHAVEIPDRVDVAGAGHANRSVANAIVTPVGTRPGCGPKMFSNRIAPWV